MLSKCTDVGARLVPDRADAGLHRADGSDGPDDAGDRAVSGADGPLRRLSEIGPLECARDRSAGAIPVFSRVDAVMRDPALSALRMLASQSQEECAATVRMQEEVHSIRARVSVNSTDGASSFDFLCKSPPGCPLSAQDGHARVYGHGTRSECAGRSERDSAVWEEVL